MDAASPKSRLGLLLFALGLSFTWPALLRAADEGSAGTKADNGTDPTRLSRIAEAKYEYLDLERGVSSGTLRLSWTQPLGARRDWALIARVPVASVDAGGQGSHDLGDASLKLSHVFGLTQTHGWVAQGEISFDTAARPELGSGKDVFKGTLIYARFLQGGGIFAPAWVQSRSLGGDSRRATVNATTFDFYYVPKMADPRNLVTLDPALNFDWENDAEFFSFAVTAGRVLGPAFGGNAIGFVKPTLFAGGDRPGSWGIELGFKVIGF
ncbi:MAG: hypothetical protein U1F18_13340 [Steroidobacteraceae bacterium]